MKRVAYLVEIKYKTVEMKLKGCSTSEIMVTSNIQKRFQDDIRWKILKMMKDTNSTNK
ncbi:hypothetical protein [Mammaliicoccus sciuri]|uniref:hypothetical protein n=1 Tax=Mammaliicoccus sciuri TaxID=1296 RepID=UPI002B25EAFC|nr:hypothetical protein [Mammaliicoccus sciuri]MEB6253555.1 hypothetical protein [Mammaliicoccus sciuri]MEB6257448.1 hypothetical protein [Mammaliicoccus sciuri]MEB7397350.1 hypothetical protein [Mammaliicoccus sciuri]MEB8190277.1 hypothetical protein [Mammaliicoccus sciuri]WQJ49628.1 hypothetical protein P3U25_13760 [Mammaliicoccus sciuri]